MAFPHLAQPQDLHTGPQLRVITDTPIVADETGTTEQNAAAEGTILRLIPRIARTAGQNTTPNGLSREAGWDEDTRPVQQGWSPPTYLPNRLTPQAAKRGIPSVMEFRRRLLSHLRKPISPSLARGEIAADASVERVYWETFGRFGSRRKLVDELVKIVRERYDDLTWQVKQTLDIAQADMRQAA